MAEIIFGFIIIIFAFIIIFYMVIAVFKMLPGLLLFLVRLFVAGGIFVMTVLLLDGIISD